MKIFNKSVFIIIAVFFLAYQVLINFNNKHNDNIKLYLVEIVLENNPDLSEFELEARVNKLFEIVKSR